MEEKALAALLAKLKIKRWLWPQLDDPNMLDKFIKLQQKPVVLPSKQSLKGLDISQEMIDDYWCFTIKPKKSPSKNHIFYIHGGAFILPISSNHWRLITDVARASKASVTVPLYPLVPEHDYRPVHRHIKKVYDMTTKQYDPDNITVIGDSAGANLALVLPLLVAKSKQPKNVIALSPVVDLRANNSDIDKLEPVDPFLPLDTIRHVLPRYYGSLDPKDPIISPLFANYKKVRPKLHLLTSGKDLLSPDVELLHKSLKEQSIDHEYVYHPHLVHAWPILPTRSAKNTRRQIAKWCC